MGRKSSIDRLDPEIKAYVQAMLASGSQTLDELIADLQARYPAAARAVGAACATNPLPIVVPCHRVLRSDGGLGGYVGGLDAKSTLLTSEHARWATRTAGPQTSREDPTTRQPSA